MARRPLIAGNWKMHGLLASADVLAKIIAGAHDLAQRSAEVDVMVCPPATLIARFAALARGTPVAIGGQDCHAEPAGPHTGDISAEMLRDAGACAVIVGHSERRQEHGETNTMVRAKAHAALRAGLLAIVCIGETRAQRDAGQAHAAVQAQLDGSLPERLDNPAEAVVVAYEPVWAIGSGLTPTGGEIADMHGFVRKRLAARFGEPAQAIRILYGGSVKPDNAKALLTADNVDGALVGGASLEAATFLAIAGVYG